ncbi:hypothetical protein Ptr902_02558 [Pyrenophora tritici-repentis]|nr:hypothetical protein Ptr902_02558 [Pyrenophora tritici-repentis]
MSEEEHGGASGIKTSLPPGMPAYRWTSLNVGMCNTRRDEVFVAKYGRTSGWSFGQINNAITAINPAQNEDFNDDAACVDGYAQRQHGYCWSVVKRRNVHGPFVVSGDAGSIYIHDPSAKWLGLLFDGTGIGSGLMMSIDMVFS